MAKISVIRIDKIQLEDNAQEPTIRSAGNDDLVVKVTVDKEIGKNARIVVDPTHVAFIIKDGKIMETLEAGEYQIFDKKRDLGRFFLLFKKSLKDSVHVVYVSKTLKVKLPWGTPRQMDMTDGAAPIKVGASGSVEVSIADPRKFFLEVVGLDRDFNTEKLQERILDKLMSKFQPGLAKFMREKEVKFGTVDEHREAIAAAVSGAIGEMLLKDYGLKMHDFYINAIVIEKGRQ